MGVELYIKTENDDLEYQFSFSNFWHVVFRDCYDYVSKMISIQEQEIIFWKLEDATIYEPYRDGYLQPVIKEPASFCKVINKIRENFSTNPEQYMCYAGGYEETRYELPAIELYEQDFIAIEKFCQKAIKEGCNIVLFGYY